MSGISKYPAQRFTELLDCQNTLTPNDILQVNSTGTEVIEVSPGTIIPPVIGTGTAFDIPTFSGSVPPIFTDSGVNINHFTHGMTGLNSISNSTSFEISETTDGHSLLMNSSNVTLTCGNGENMLLNCAGGGGIHANVQTLKLDISSDSGSLGDVLTADGTGNCSWVPASGGGSLPTYTSQSVNVTMFGSSSDAGMGLASSEGSAPCFYYPADLPWPCPNGSGTFSPTIPYNLGTVPFTLVPGNYALCCGFLGNLGTPIATFTVTNVTTGGLPSVLTFDTYINNSNNPQLNCLLQFTVSGTGYQDILVNLSVLSANILSSGTALLPCTDLIISPVYTV